MPIRVVQLGSDRAPEEGIRLGTVRRPPRGVSKADFSRLNYYDVWLPQLSPSAGLVKQAQASSDDRAWKSFQNAFRREMAQPDTARLLDLLAALSHQTSFSLGCYCEQESHCHRSILRELLAERGAAIS